MADTDLTPQYFSKSVDALIDSQRGDGVTGAAVGMIADKLKEDSDDDSIGAKIKRGWKWFTNLINGLIDMIFSFLFPDNHTAEKTMDSAVRASGKYTAVAQKLGLDAAIGTELQAATIDDIRDTIGVMGMSSSKAAAFNAGLKNYAHDVEILETAMKKKSGTELTDAQTQQVEENAAVLSGIKVTIARAKPEDAITMLTDHLPTSGLAAMLLTSQNGVTSKHTKGTYTGTDIQLHFDDALGNEPVAPPAPPPPVTTTPAPGATTPAAPVRIRARV